MITFKKTLYILLCYIAFNAIFSIYDYKNDIHFFSYIPCIIALLFGLSLLYKSYKRDTKYKYYSLITGLGILSYLIGSICDLLTGIYSHYNISNIFYILTSLCLSISIWILVKQNSTKWRRVYVLLDTFILGIFIMYIGCEVFFDKLLPKLSYLDWNNFAIFNFLTFALISLLGLLTLFQLNKASKCSKYLLIGFYLFTSTELLYYYLYLESRIIHSSKLTAWSCYLLWELSLLLICFSTYFITSNYTSKNNVNNIELTPDAIKNNLPLSTILLFILSLLVCNNIAVTIFLALLLIFRQITLKYIHTYVSNDHLNAQYKMINKALAESLENLRKKNEELYVSANIDPLTNLPNRRNFIEHLDSLINNKNPNECFALLFINLDRFKSINDWYGHEIGDEILLKTSNRLKYFIEKDDFLARQGGDEFILILKNIKDMDDALNKSYKLVEIFRRPFIINDMNLIATASIGVSIYPLSDTIRSNLMKYSDIALHAAKKSGKNNCKIYNNDIRKKETRKLEIESKLHDSISNNELVLFFQPQVNSTTGKLIGLEALIRWTNSDIGFVSPMEFITIAEENGFITNIGDWVIDEALSKIKYLNEKYNTNIKVGINVSPKQFILSDLSDSLSNSINKHNINPNWIDIEITESCSMQNEEETIKKLCDLKNLGVKISVDDFGTGYSSLIYLKRYPIDTLKIALELVREINNNSENYNIVKAIISMCNAMNLNTIAEGVEYEEQLELLKTLGCNEIQGYYYGKPMPLANIEETFFINNK